MAKLAKNELLFRQGDSGDTFYIVAKVSCDVTDDVTDDATF